MIEKAATGSNECSPHQDAGHVRIRGLEFISRTGSILIYIFKCILYVAQQLIG